MPGYDAWLAQLLCAKNFVTVYMVLKLKFARKICDCDHRIQSQIFLANLILRPYMVTNFFAIFCEPEVYILL